MSLIAVLAASCVLAASPEAEPAGTKAAPDLSTLAIPAEGQTVRIAGDLEVQTGRAGEGEGTTFSTEGVNTIDTPLPIGYPDPTPPGAIDIKMYPSVRRAEVSGEVKTGRDSEDGFWPLFKHIQRRNIAMTSPVEMAYRPTAAQTAAQTAAAPAPAASEPSTDAEASPARSTTDAASNAEVPNKEQWTMSFLYRRAEQGETGEDAKDARVKIVDVPAQLVVSVGMKGNYSRDLIAGGEQKLDAWLASQKRFERAGDSRVLYYHGPSLRPWRKWAEVQMPIREVRSPIKADDAR